MTRPSKDGEALELKEFPSSGSREQSYQPNVCRFTLSPIMSYCNLSLQLRLHCSFCCIRRMVICSALILNKILGQIRCSGASGPRHSHEDLTDFSDSLSFYQLSKSQYYTAIHICRAICAVIFTSPFLFWDSYDILVCKVKIPGIGLYQSPGMVTVMTEMEF